MLIFSLCLLLFINAMSIGLVFPIFAPLFTESAHTLFAPGTSQSTGTFLYTMILTIPTIFMIIGAPFLGRLSDRFGRRQILLIGLSGVAISFILSAFGIVSKSLYVLFFSRALAGFMDGSEAIAQAAIADFTPLESKARNMGYATFAGTIGFIIGPVVGGFLANPVIGGIYHYELPFIASFVLTAVNALILYCYFPEENLVKPFVLLSWSKYFAIFIRGFIITLDKRIIRYSFLLLVINWCLAVFFQVSTLAMVEKFHYTSSQVGIFTTVLGACFSGGIFLVIYILLHILSHASLLKSGSLLIGLAAILAIYLNNSVIFAWVTVVPLMFGIAMMYNVLLAMISNSVTSEEQGDAMGSSSALKALGWICSSIIISICYPDLKLTFIVVLIVTGLAFLVSLTINPANTVNSD